MYLLILWLSAVFSCCFQVFTSHYVSINSGLICSLISNVIVFTSHYVSINSRLPVLRRSCFLHLHPTMYLLIPKAEGSNYTLISLFTSLYVSINSLPVLIFVLSAHPFTSHYVSINSRPLKQLQTFHSYLHPTMYLLIRRLFITSWR